MMNNKVFSIRAYFESMAKDEVLPIDSRSMAGIILTESIRDEGWVLECEGLRVSEFKNGYGVTDSWLVDVDKYEPIEDLDEFLKKYVGTY